MDIATVEIIEKLAARTIGAVMLDNKLGDRGIIHIALTGDKNAPGIKAVNEAKAATTTGSVQPFKEGDKVLGNVRDLEYPFQLILDRATGHGLLECKLAVIDQELDYVDARRRDSVAFGDRRIHLIDAVNGGGLCKV